MAVTSRKLTARLFARRLYILALSGLGLLLAVAGCVAGTADSSPPPAVAPAPTPSIQPPPTSITISGFAFAPPSVEITAGSSVIWTNSDTVVHTVTSNNGIFDSGRLPGNATFNFTFTSPGLYEYHCTPHPYMKGQILVK